MILHQPVEAMIFLTVTLQIMLPLATVRTEALFQSLVPVPQVSALTSLEVIHLTWLQPRVLPVLQQTLQDFVYLSFHFQIQAVSCQ